MKNLRGPLSSERVGNYRSGFTFIEIMFVVVIIGLLASVVAGNISRGGQKARVVKAEADINSLKSAVTNFELNIGEIPSESEGLIALIERPADANKDDWKGPYVEDIPKDPWGNEYIYKSPGEHGWPFEIHSMGPDKKDGTEDDINSWKRDLSNNEN